MPIHSDCIFQQKYSKSNKFDIYLQVGKHGVCVCVANVAILLYATVKGVGMDCVVRAYLDSSTFQADVSRECEL